MQLLKLEVKNWVHHRYRVCEFTRGLIGILGENGSGKSSLFGAIRWLLTGENPNYGIKADNVSQYAKPGEPSFASLEFEHNGHYAVVTRHLLPDKEPSTLIIDNKEVARGDKAVTAGIEKLLGVDAKFISRFIIVSQTEIFSFIDDNQTDTDKFFQRLFNTSKADKCQDVIGKSLLKTSPPEIIKTSAQLIIEREAVQADIAALNKDISALPSLDVFLREQEQDQLVIRQWESRERSAAELQQLDQTIQRQQQQVSTARETCTQYEKDLSAFSDAIDGKVDAHQAAKIALGHWENYKTVAAAKDNFAAARAAIEEARAKDPAPEQPGPLASKDMWLDVQARESRIKDAERFVRMFLEDGVAECPTCHTPSSALATQAEKCKAELVEMRAALNELTTAANKQEKFEQDWVSWERRQKIREVQAQQLDESEKNLLSVKPPETTEEELQKTVLDYEAFALAQKELQPLIQSSREDIAKLQGAITAAETRRQALLDAIRAIATTAADAHLANLRLEDMKKKCGQRQLLEQQRAKLVADVDQFNNQIEQAQKQERDAVKIRNWSVVAERARDALKNAPRMVAQRNLQRLEAAINELLQIFSVNFLVRVSNDGTPTFVAEFYDGRKQVAQRLSIGQKTVLALAFRVAVNAQFAEEIGLLALDEPTASLDAPRIQALAPVLEKLRDLSTAKGLQCLLVTHAASLSHLFESTIELEPPELRHVRPAR